MNYQNDTFDISNVPEWNYCLNLLVHDDFSEIQVNGPNEFFTKQKGKRVHLEDIKLETAERLISGIKNGLIPHVVSHEEFDENGYLFEGPLEYEAEGKKIKGRCHIVLYPASRYPQITIAKKSTALPTLDSIASRGSMSSEMLAFIKAAIEIKLTMVMSGGTGAGKTTMLEAATKYMSNTERIGVAEDTPELVLTQDNVTYLHSVPWSPGMDPNKVATLSWVVQQFQRMRTDRLIIGETRGVEFADFLTAANSGMEGSMTTLHASTPKQCLDKMTNFAIRATASPLRTVNNDIANSVDIIVQLIILPDGRHRVAQIEEVTTTLGNDEAARPTTETLYRYDPRTDNFIKAGKMTDNLRKRFEEKGVDIELFLTTPIGSTAGPHDEENDTEVKMVRSGWAGASARMQSASPQSGNQNQIPSNSAPGLASPPQHPHSSPPQHEPQSSNSTPPLDESQKSRPPGGLRGLPFGRDRNGS